MERPKYPVLTVMKALEILKVLSNDSSNRGIGISEFSRELDLGKSTIHRILETLMYYGFVDKDEDTNRYRLGWTLYNIGQMVPRQNQLLTLDNALLIELSKKVKETVNLGILKEPEVVIVSKIESSTKNMRVLLQPGEHEALHATALGKILLSELGEDKIRAMLARNPDKFKKLSDNTITDADELIKEIEKTRERGYAVDNEEFCRGLYCVAMPLKDYTDKIVGAASVSFPYARMNPEKITEILGYLTEYTGKISRILGYRNKDFQERG